ncbi:Hypothetical predicted protein [Paramuricea clavata]|uniref:Uncharacterized protein n=1 Tax=Paramuricea clavata TaxID=317549 RepID=A0A7D9HWZ7_PARCT|nr:Hypothetical predicted protein [Paramuricea clavata]
MGVLLLNIGWPGCYLSYKQMVWVSQGNLVEMAKILTHLKLTKEKFTDMCIAAGCDYIENIRGYIGCVSESSELSSDDEANEVLGCKNGYDSENDYESENDLVYENESPYDTEDDSQSQSSTEFDINSDSEEHYKRVFATDNNLRSEPKFIVFFTQLFLNFVPIAKQKILMLRFTKMVLWPKLNVPVPTLSVTIRISRGPVNPLFLEQDYELEISCCLLQLLLLEHLQPKS